MLYEKNRQYLNEIIRMSQELLAEVADEESQQGIADAYDELECVIEDYETEGFNFGDKSGAQKYDPSGIYFHEDITAWEPTQKYDVVFWSNH